MELNRPAVQCILLLLLLCLVQGTLSGQEVQREIGIRTQGLNNLGAVYKWEVEPGKYNRLTAALVALRGGVNPDILDFDVTVNYGSEKRRDLGQSTDFLHGVLWGVSAGYRDNEESRSDPTANVGVSISFLIGIQYRVSDLFHVGLEFLPGISMSTLFNDDTSDDTSLMLIGSANLNSVSVFAVYRFSSPGKE